MSKDERAAVRELANALRALHRHALTLTQQGFEKVNGPVRGPGELLQLAVHDPLFAWLRPLSQEIVGLDELAEADELGAPDLDAARNSVAELLDTTSEFRASYLVYLQEDPDLVLAHAAVRRLLRRRPGDGAAAPQS
ncbi:MAG TPA: hypothetical protein VFO94_10160 [Gammaproteobacteria bacterium]|nr:hypothetical protein [Gammaproteobacteria bacterium]